MAATKRGVHSTLVIPSYNGRALLEENLALVVAEAEAWPDGCRVVVVDDGSTDGTGDWLSEQWPTVELVRLSRNRGFAAAMNAGIAAASGEFLVALNNDVQVSTGFLASMLAALETPTTFAVGCRTLLDPTGRDEGLTEGGFRQGRFEVMQPGLRADCPPAWPRRATLYAHGGASAYRLAALRDLGGFDDLYAPFYWEDLDLCYRAWKRGWDVVYEPTSTVYHRHQATIGAHYSYAFIRRLMARNLWLFTWKNVTDPGLLASHVAWLAARTASHLARADSAFVGALTSALQRLPLVLKGRRNEVAHRVHSDAEVLTRSRDFDAGAAVRSPRRLEV